MSKCLELLCFPVKRPRHTPAAPPRDKEAEIVIQQRWQAIPTDISCVSALGIERKAALKDAARGTFCKAREFCIAAGHFGEHRADQQANGPASRIPSRPLQVSPLR